MRCRAPERSGTHGGDGVKHFETLCTVRGGKLKLFDLKSFEQACGQFADGEELVLELRTPEQKRSLAQNRFFHGPILSAFMTLGYHKQEAKDMLALHLIPQEVRQLDGSVVRVPGHTSELSKEEFNDFIDACLQLAAENDLIVEDSDQWRRKGTAA